MPYENVSDWKVYPDIPVLVQYHDRGSGKTRKDHERPREQGESDPLQEPLKPFALAKDLFLQASPGKEVTDGSDGSAK